MDDGGLAPSRHRVDVATLYCMADAGIFTPSDRIELIDGEIIDMAPIGSGHVATVNVLTRTLVTVCGDRALLSVRNPARVDDFNEPMPDLVLFRPRADDYRTPPGGGARDALAVIEVSNTSLQFDRTVKLPLYARAGFAEYWIVDLKHRVVTVYTDPAGDEYAAIRTYRSHDSIALSQAPGIVIPLDRVFG